ncbi:phage tail tape measure protein, partial [Mycolicibacterium fortuitum]|nr:phage tail tape measure protein [Mycolicibacterium fortuitum]
MRRDIARALNQATRNAAINPQLNTSGMSSQANRAGRDFGTRFGAAAKTAIAAAGIGVGIAGIASQFKQVMSVGMDWTNNMNTLRAVTGGTADELKKAADAARALGNDISLPATSANDAASAMTELAKGGFTVQQAMDAAKGSLQLAAAAQISATDAATIQSQALQAFGLSASSAGKMSDTLANAANASSAEITDVAQAMQQAGTVANQFGLSAEDTAAAIGLLANNGIKGSDAGTLLKSSLLALTDQGNPAQGAIKELGLTVYDATGKFVGLHSLYGQLG